VKDTVRGFIKVAQSDRTIGQVTNVGFGKGITIGDLAKTILSLMGSEKQIVLDSDRVRPSKSEVFKLICDNTQALERADWKPQYSLEAGLKEVIAFVSSNQGLFKSERYAV
jgi:nucleoside-diphosphate-sugar epimerase